MNVLKKHIIKIILLMFTCIINTMQAKAQFDDEGGPGGFDPPPPNDVPLDTYQWIMLGFGVLYGLYIFLKHHKNNQKQVSKG